MNERQRRAAQRRARDQASVPRSPRARRLVQRASTVDRHRRFAQRLTQVAAARARERRRRRLLAVVGTVGALVVGAGAGAGVARLVGESSGGWAAGALLGAAAAAVVVLGAAALRRAAVARGARAWDWQAQRHVLLGDPSAEVRAADGPSGDNRGR